MALELREKAQGIGIDLTQQPVSIHSVEEKSTLDDALSALRNLGYPEKSARRAVEKASANVDQISIESIIREALKMLT